MKKILLAAVLFTTTNIGCKNMGNGDPKVVLVSFFDALGKGDIAKAKTLATPESQMMLGFMEMGAAEAKKKGEMDKFNKDNMEIGEALIEGDKATVTTKEKKSGETLKFTLKKIDGNWKVAFDKSSLMTMGMDKAKEKGINITDSLNTGLDELNKINIDSLKNEMNKAMDTANKSLKENQ